MTVHDALRKHGISRSQWALFLRIAEANATTPTRHRGEKRDSYGKRLSKWIDDSRGGRDSFPPSPHWIGGMQDALWAWVEEEMPAYEILLATMLHRARKAFDDKTDGLMKDALGNGKSGIDPTSGRLIGSNHEAAQRRIRST